MSTTRTIRVDQLARVEGEGALQIKVKGDRVESVRFRIFEPPRFFEALLRDRSFLEAPDITARICGICPVAYQMSAVHAMEDACGVQVTGELRALRRLLYCGEWIESHTLHIYLLHAPDFLGYQDAIALASDQPELVERALKLKKIGNEIVALLGGREVHPINVRVGGFYRVPTRRELGALTENLEWAREAALETVRVVAGFSFPDFERPTTYVALRHPTEYPFNEGRIVSSRGLDCAIREYPEYFTENQVPHSTALHSTLHQKERYQVGPLARYNLNFDRLSSVAQQAARSAGLTPVVRNPFKSIIVRAVELVQVCDEAIGIVAAYHQPDEAAIPVEPQAGIGHGCTEAPRGLLYHRYRIDDQGAIQAAMIVPPTAQNQDVIEDDLSAFVAQRLDLPDDQLTWQCEQAVRNYDPCLSCSTHFLRLTVERS